MTTELVSPSRPGPAHLALGRFGELWAARELVSDGLVLLERNWRCPLGEVDLVMREGRVLVLVEVKTRSSHSHGSGIEAVDATKVARLRALAEEWMSQRGVRPAEVRIDIVDLLVVDSAVVSLEHIRGVG
jgi:putative endonuclease